jgi:biotin transport system permease protein
VLADKGAQLSDAWRARSPKRPKWHIVTPFAVLAIDDAEHVADAIKARGGL